MPEEFEPEKSEREKVRAICLVSGGMDSCVTAAIAARDGCELALLHVSYGQLTEARERRAFEEIADFYKVEKRLAVSIEHLARIGGSSLTDKNIPIAEANIGSPEIPASYVPFRNAHLLAIAASWAEVSAPKGSISARWRKIPAAIPIAVPNFLPPLIKASKPARARKPG